MSQDALIIGQRAYLTARIYVDPVNLDSNKDSKYRQYRFGIELTNTGNTPARVTGVTAKWDLTGGWPAAYKDWNDHVGSREESYVVGGKQTQKIEVALEGIELLGPKGIGLSQMLPPISIHYAYRDIFGSQHSDESIGCSYALMISDGDVKELYTIKCSSRTNDPFTR